MRSHCGWFRYLLLLWPLTATSALSVEDDAGNRVVLAQPAQRIISLAPHITETLFAIGAGAHIVGAVQYSDYPEVAKDIPRIGSYNLLNVEDIVALKPDLIVVWQSGNPAAQLATLRSLGFTIFVSEPHRVQDVARNMERLGVLAGVEMTAHQQSEYLVKRFEDLRQRYQSREKISVFYQFWSRPIMTIGGDSLVNNVITQCGGRNIFSGLTASAPAVNREAVLAANPEVIIAGSMANTRPKWLEQWRRWPQLQAVRENRLFAVNADLLHRHGPRIIRGMEEVCVKLDEVRKGRSRH